MAIFNSFSPPPICRTKVTRMYFFILHLSIADILTAFFTLLPEMIWDGGHLSQTESLSAFNLTVNRGGKSGRLFWDNSPNKHQQHSTIKVLVFLNHLSH